STANDAKDLASGINELGVGGLTASANETTKAGATQASATVTQDGAAVFTINGVEVDIATTQSTSNAERLETAISSINNASAATGVKAVNNGGVIDLQAIDGRNITTAFAEGTATGATAAGFGLGANGTQGASINIDYKAPTGVTSDVTFAGAFNPGGQSIGVTGTALNAIDISTPSGSEKALNSVDAALDTVNSARASLGALQNRFESTIANLSTSVENLSASNSRILDADFAAETANLAKSQVLQQAGISVLSQANARPQQVLSLLQ
ncbi:flagellin, partial [Marinobacter sp.]